MINNWYNNLHINKLFCFFYTQFIPLIFLLIKTTVYLYRCGGINIKLQHVKCTL